MASFEEQLLVSNTMMKKRKCGKGRQKIEMKKMSESTHRQVTFSKRRQTLFKNAEKLVRSSPYTRLAVFALSERGTPYSYGNCPDAETLIDQFLATDHHGCHNDDDAPVNDIIGCGVGVENLGLEELDGYAKFLMAMSSDIEKRNNNFEINKKETLLQEGHQDLGPVHDPEWMNCGELELDYAEWMMEIIGSDGENRIDNNMMIDNNSKVINASICPDPDEKNVETEVHNGDSGLVIDDSDQLVNAAFPWINPDLGLDDDLQWMNGTHDLRLVDDFQWMNGLFQDTENLN